MKSPAIINIDFGAAAATGKELFSAPAYDLFRNNELIAGIPEEAFAAVRHKIEILHCAPREVIFNEEEPGDSLYLIAQGSVRISKKGRGGQQETLTFLMERDFFGEMALVDSGCRSAQASAASHTVLGRIDRPTWALLLKLAPQEVLSNFTRSVTRRLRSNNQHFIEEMMRNERLSLLGTTISSIVHDMNNPISCILGACEMMQAKIQTELGEKMTRMIREAVDRMNVMTRELIEFSRGNTQLTIRPTSTMELLEGLESDFAACAKAGVTVEKEIFYNGQIQVDRGRMNRVFSNLVRNARDAMKKGAGGAIHFRAEQVGQEVCFEVSDSGCGIPEHLLPKIFEPFVTHGKTHGTGLGLAIAKAVVEAHRGTISVRSEEGKGTTFTVRLPLAP